MEQSADIFVSLGRWGSRCCLRVPAEWEGCRGDSGREKTTSQVISTFIQPHLLPRKIPKNILINQLIRDKQPFTPVYLSRQMLRDLMSLTSRFLDILSADVQIFVLGGRLSPERRTYYALGGTAQIQQIEVLQNLI